MYSTEESSEESTSEDVKKFWEEESTHSFCLQEEDADDEHDELDDELDYEDSGDIIKIIFKGHKRFKACVTS